MTWLVHNELRHLSDQKLLESTRQAVDQERRVTARVLEHLEEVERRKLYLEMNHPSLFVFCLRELRYSEDQAYARIAAMRLSREVPEVVAAVEDGRLSLTNLVRAQKFVRQEKQAGHSLSVEEKRDLLTQLEGKSTREAERMLADLSPHALPEERARVVSSTHTQVSFVADEELMADLQRLRELWGHQNLSYAELIQKMAKLALKKVDPLLKAPKAPKVPGAPQVDPLQVTPANPESDEARQTTNDPEGDLESLPSPPPESVIPNSRFIDATTRHAVWQRDQGQCTHTGRDGTRCSSRWAIEIDHVDPYAYGGVHTPDNLRLLCAAHHRHRHRHRHRHGAHSRVVVS